MKKLVAKVLGIKEGNPAHEQLITEPKGTLLNPFTNSSLEHIVEYHYPKPEDVESEEEKAQLAAHEGDVVTLHYQHTFNRTSGKDEFSLGINTATTEQRPDIVLNIRKSSGEVILTYLYDSKYRVINDKQLDMDFEDQDIDENTIMPGGDYPPTDAINQMHRYRDAIYYSKEHEPYRSKEIIGGYILFPGRGNDEYIKRRYYSNSIESVNIGAFPLLPNSDTLVEEHLRKILMEYTNTEKHVEKAKPQRTLAYVTEEEKAGFVNDLVMIAIAGSEEKRNWALENCWYNIPLDQVADCPIMQAKYLLLYVRNEGKAGNIRKIVKSRFDVWTAETLQNGIRGGKRLSYPYPGEPHQPSYFMMRIHKDSQTESALKDKVFDLRNFSHFYWGTPKMTFFFVRLKDLIEYKQNFENEL